MKKFENIFIALLISIIVVSCGSNTQTEETSNDSLNTVASSVETSKSVDETSKLSETDTTQEKEVVEDITVSETTSNNVDIKTTTAPKSEDAVSTQVPKTNETSTPVTKSTQSSTTDTNSKATTTTTKPKATSTPVATATPKETTKPTQTPAPANAEKTVTISVKGIDNVIVPKTSVAIKDGDTVYDVLVKVLDSNGISYSSRGSKKNKYIEGIDGLFEFDHGPKSGFVYEVNGVYASQSSSSSPLSGNENIVWYYTQ